MISIRKTMAWWLCLMLCLSLYGSSSCEVLCFSDQGPVAIEPAHFEACCDNELAVPAADGEGEDCHRHDCAGCSGIPLDSSPWWQRSRVASGPTVRVFALQPVDSFDDQTLNSDSNFQHTWMSAADARPVIPMATAPTVLRC